MSEAEESATGIDELSLPQRAHVDEQSISGQDFGCGLDM